MTNKDEPRADELLGGPVREWLRERLEPDAAVVGRVVRHATAAPGQRRRSLAPVLATTIGILAAIASAVWVHWEGLVSRSPAPPDAETITITNASGRLVILRSPPPELPRVSNVGGVLCAALPGHPPRYLVVGGGSWDTE